MKFLFLALLLTAQARPADDDIVGTTVVDIPTTPSFDYSSTTKKIDTSHWRYKGRKVSYTADSLVTSSCSETSGVRILFPTDSNQHEYACNESALMSEKLAEMIDKYLKSCAQQALSAAGVTNTIRRADLNSLGIINARRVNKGGSGGCSGQGISEKSGRNCSISYHATGRAIDADSITITSSDNTVTTYPLACVDASGKTNEGFDKSCNRSGKNGKFYDAFNLCLNQNIKKHANCADPVMDCTDAQHKDHVHISLPLCPRPRGIAKS